MYEIILELLGGSTYFPASNNYSYNSNVQYVTMVTVVLITVLFLDTLIRCIENILRRKH